MTEARAAIFPARRAIERANATPGARPIRLFALLLPVWCVEVSATVREAQPYEVLDGFLTRAIAQAQIGDADELATFFGIRRTLVDRALKFLETIGHIRQAGDVVTLTELGAQSVRDGCRYQLKEDHQRLYLDAFTCGPMPTSHYSRITYLSEPALTGADRTRFQPLTSLVPFDSGALTRLFARPDRRDFHSPDGLRDARPLSLEQEWLPVYAVQNAGDPPYLAFSMAIEGRDRHLEPIIAMLGDTLVAERTADPWQVWREWLDVEGFRDVVPQRLGNGVLRAVLPARAFGSGVRFRLYQLGSFETRQRSFMQLWCADDELRRQAVLERAVQRTASGAFRTAGDLRTALGELATQLAVTPVSVEDAYWYANQHQDDLALAALDMLT